MPDNDAIHQAFLARDDINSARAAGLSDWADMMEADLRQMWEPDE